MTWFKVDDRFHSHPKVIDLSLAAVGLWVRAGSWCADHEKANGEVSRALLRMIGAEPALANELVKAGLWERTEDGWRFHDWHEYQPTPQLIAERREAEKLKKRRQRAGPVPPGHPAGPLHFPPGTPGAPDPDPTRPEPTPTENKLKLSATDALRPEYLRAAAGAGWLSKATGQEPYSTNSASKHFRALVDLASKPEPERVLASRVLAREAQKSDVVGFLTPQHVIDNWRFYGKGEAPGKPVARAANSGRRFAGPSRVPTAAEYAADLTEKAPWEI